MISTFIAEIESIAAADRLSMGELAALVTARSVFSREQVEFKVPRQNDLKIGSRVKVTVEVLA